jgi:hypothetical protein
VPTTSNGGTGPNPAEAADRLGAGARAIAAALAAELRKVEARHGLDGHELFAEQARVEDLARWGLAPTAASFYTEAAEPRARRLTVAGRAVIDHHLGLLDVLVDEAVKVPGADRHPSWEPAVAAVAAVAGAFPRAERLAAVGDRWHGRLRRAALARGAVELLWSPAGEAVDRLQALELALVDRVPWAHGDQLLLAFETAWTELGRYLRRQVRARVDRLAPPPPGLARALGEL